MPTIQKVGKKFIPPLAQLTLQDAKWIDYSVPELLWITLLLLRYGMKGSTDLSILLARAAKKAVGETNPTPFFATTSSYKNLSQMEREKVLDSLDKKQQMQLFTALHPLIALYPSCPLSFLGSADVAVSGTDSMSEISFVKEAIVALIDKRSYEATWVMANALNIAVLTGKVRYSYAPPPNIEAVVNYPATDESRKVASSLRASLNILMCQSVEPEWGEYFWNRGMELESCSVEEW